MPQMTRDRIGRIGTSRMVGGAALIVAACGLAAGLGGCETDSFLDPSVVGRWEHTPTKVPILTRLSAIEDEPEQFVEHTEVTPEDLIPQPNEYRIGPGDRLQVALYDDVSTGQPGVYERPVDIRGMIDLPQLGQININNRTQEQAREIIRQALSKFVNDPLVSLVVVEARQQTYNVIGAVQTPGPYFISKPDFRLLEAINSAGQFSEDTEYVLVIRQIALRDDVKGVLPNPPGGGPGSAVPPSGGAAKPVTPETPAPPPDKVIDLIDELSKPKDPAPEAKPETPEEAPEKKSTASSKAAFGALAGAGATRPTRRPQPPATPPAQPPSGEPPVDLIDSPASNRAGDPKPSPTAAQPNNSAGWVFVNGQWVQTKAAPSSRPVPNPSGNDPLLTADQLMTQRVIRVPLKPLIAGDSKFNIVIHPGDIIRMPSPERGLVYVVGQVARAGPYNLPDIGKMTLTRAIHSAGGFGSLAIPERVDLTRIVGKNVQATIRLDVRAITEGSMPDVYIRPDDVVNVGTNFWAYPLAVFRSGLRMSYGFGFVLDRNFANEVFGVQKTNSLGQ